MFLKTKKSLAVVLSLMMTLTLLAPISDITPVFAEMEIETYITAAGKAQAANVDGSLNEGFWSKAEWNGVVNRQVATTLNNSVQFATAWDSKNLYVGVKVSDATIVTENLNSAIYCNDGIEIFVDPNNAKSTKEYDEQTIHFMYQVADGKSAVWGTKSVWTDITEQYPGIKSAHTLTDGGYTLEVAFPFEEIGVTAPNDGKIIGVEICNNDDDNPASNGETDRGSLYWNQSTAANSPDTWGSVVLYNAVKPTIAYKGTPKVDGKINDNDGWIYTSERTNSDNVYKYNVASACDDKYFYVAIKATGADFKDASLNLLIDVDNTKAAKPQKLIQVVNYDLATNETQGIYGVSSRDVVDIKGSVYDNECDIELKALLSELNVKPSNLTVLAMEIEFFKDKTNEGGQSYSGSSRTKWSNATEESLWSSSSSYGSIVFNNVMVGGGKNDAPTGNQISSHSIPQGGSVSGKLTPVDPNGDELTFRLDPNNEIPGEDKGTFKLDSKTGEWSYVTPDDSFLAPDGVSYYVQSDDGKGGTFHQRVDIRVESKPTNLIYYVDGDTGSDSNNGLSEEKPFKTIMKAAKIVNPGDTVIVHESEIPYGYADRYIHVLSRSGLPEAYITYKAAEGEQPVINTKGKWKTVLIDGSYIKFEGFTIKGNADEIMDTTAESFKKVYDYYYSKAAPADDPLYNPSYGDEISYYNSNALGIDPNDNKHVQQVGIDNVKVVHHVEVRNCLIEYLPGCGIGTSSSDYITIENNTIVNNGWTDMYATSGISSLGNIDIDDKFDEHKMIIRNNITGGNRHFVPWISLKKLSDGNGIIIDSTDNASKNKTLLGNGDLWGLLPYAGRHLVANNVSFLNGGSGIHVFDADHTDIINNTIFSNSHTIFLNWSDFFVNRSDDINLYNNIVYSRTGSSMHISGAGNVDVNYDNNLFYNYDESNNNLGKTLNGKNGNTGTTPGNNNIYGKNPLFVNAYEINHDSGKGFPSSWTPEMVKFAENAGYFVGADYSVPKDYDFSIASNSPAIGTANAEWAKVAGLDTKNMGAQGTIGSSLRPMTIGIGGEGTPSTPADEITVMLDGVKVIFPDVKPFLYQDRTLVPFRAIFEAMGATVGWEEATETVTGNLGDKSVVLQINNKIATANGQQIELDVPAMLHEDRTMVPLRFIAESLGAKVDWVDATQTVIIATK